VKYAISAKTAALAAALLLAGATVVGALTAPDDDTEGDEPHGVEQTLHPDDQADEDGDAQGVEDSDDQPDALDAEDSGKPTDNHGAAVSNVAHDDSLEGREHGEAVSDVARSDIGKTHADDEGDDEGDEELDEAEHGHGDEHGGGDSEDEESDGGD